MKILVTGSRKWRSKATIAMILAEYPGAMIIEGGANGADALAGEYAEEHGLPHVIVPANWDYYGKKAGPIRNEWMVKLEPDVCVAFPHKDSVGTYHCALAASRAGIKVRYIE